MMQPVKPEYTESSERLAVSVDEAAKMLSVSRRTMAYLVANGTIRSSKIGRCRRISVADLVAFLDQSAVA